MTKGKSIKYLKNINFKFLTAYFNFSLEAQTRAQMSSLQGFLAQNFPQALVPKPLPKVKSGEVFEIKVVPKVVPIAEQEDKDEVPTGELDLPNKAKRMAIVKAIRQQLINNQFWIKGWNGERPLKVDLAFLRQNIPCNHILSIMSGGRKDYDTRFMCVLHKPDLHKWCDEKYPDDGWRDVGENYMPCCMSTNFVKKLNDDLTCYCLEVHTLVKTTCWWVRDEAEPHRDYVRSIETKFCFLHS